jgi:hypothetical protein
MDAAVREQQRLIWDYRRLDLPLASTKLSDHEPAAAAATENGPPRNASSSTTSEAVTDATRTLAPGIQKPNVYTVLQKIWQHGQSIH